MLDRKQFVVGLGAALTAAGCRIPCGEVRRKGRIALQLFSIREYIGGVRNAQKEIVRSGVGLEKALAEVAEMGYAGVEMAGYYGFDASELARMLKSNGLVACGTHVSCTTFGVDARANSYDPEALKRTAEFNLSYGNSFLCCPGNGTAPDGVNWRMGWNGTRGVLTPAQEEHAKRLCDLYNRAAADATRCGCRIGLHNHTWELSYSFRNGISFWDYFFSNTDPSVCMEQDIGWTTFAEFDPCDQWRKYPHRSPTLHAKENGLGKDVIAFDGVLGQPGKPDAKPVEWDRVLPAAEDDGVEWWVVECEKHADDLSAVAPSCRFLKSLGLGI